MVIYVDKNNKDSETKNGMSSFLKYNLQDKIAKRKVGKGFRENTHPIKDNFLKKTSDIGKLALKSTIGL